MKKKDVYLRNDLRKMQGVLLFKWRGYGFFKNGDNKALYDQKFLADTRASAAKL